MSFELSKECSDIQRPIINWKWEMPPNYDLITLESKAVLLCIKIIGLRFLLCNSQSVACVSKPQLIGSPHNKDLFCNEAKEIPLQLQNPVQIIMTSWVRRPI